MTRWRKQIVAATMASFAHSACPKPSSTPHKHNASHRHRIGKMKFKVTNWGEYEAGLCRRGSLTLWVTPQALSAWAAPRRKTRGGQPLYSDLAIKTTLMLAMVFGLRLRQNDGLRRMCTFIFWSIVPV